MIAASGARYNYAVDAQGNFNGSFITCGNESYVLTALNYSTLERSTPIRISATVDTIVGTLNACTATFSNFMKLTVDGALVFQDTGAFADADSSFQFLYRLSPSYPVGGTLELVCREGLPFQTTQHTFGPNSYLGWESPAGVKSYNLSTMSIDLIYSPPGSTIPGTLNGVLGPIDANFTIDSIPGGSEEIKFEFIIDIR